VVCHGGSRPSRGLSLESYEGILKGSTRRKVVVPGDPEASEILRRLRGTSEPRMPLDGPPYLSEEEIARFEAWIAAGARRGEEETPVPKKDQEGNVEGSEPARTGAPADGPPVRPGEVRYPEVERILKPSCVVCHTRSGLRGEAPEGLRLGTLSDILASGERAVVVPGNPLASELYRKITGMSRPPMPLEGPPLSTEEVSLVRRWIEGGCLNAEGRPSPIPVGRPVRLQGTLTGPSNLDGMSFVVAPGARRDDRTSVGTRVRLRGRVGRDGEVVVERVQRR
jgi:hypothetical protein